MLFIALILLAETSQAFVTVKGYNGVYGYPHHGYAYGHPITALNSVGRGYYSSPYSHYSSAYPAPLGPPVENYDAAPIDAYTPVLPDAHDYAPVDYAEPIAADPVIQAYTSSGAVLEAVPAVPELHHSVSYINEAAAAPLVEEPLPTISYAAADAAPAVTVHHAAAPAPVYAAAPAPVHAAVDPAPVYAAAPAVAAPVAVHAVAEAPVAVHHAAAPVEVHAVDAPIEVVRDADSFQFHAQDELGNVEYGYKNANSAKHETTSADGFVRGTYSYLDEAGAHTITYVADDWGFRLV